MGITDVKRLWGTPLGVVGAYSGPSGAPPVTPVAPNRCPCAVLLSTGRGSYNWPERVLLLDSVTTVVPIEHSRSTSSRGGVVSVLARGSMYLRQVRGVPILSCMENIELWCVGAV